MTKSLNKTFLILFLIVATELIGFGLIIPVLPVLATQFEIGNFSLGILMASFSLSQFIASPILGSLSDKFGRKPILVLSKLGTVLSYIILAFSNNYVLFLCSRLLDGFTGGNIAVARAYIADVTDQKTRSKGMAVIGISFGVGFIFGPILGALLYRGMNGQFITALVAGALSFIAMILTMILLKEPKDRKPIQSVYVHLKKGVLEFKNISVVIIFLTYLLYMIVFSGFETTFSMYLNYIFSMNLNEIMWLFVFSGVVGLIVQGYLSKKTVIHFKGLIAIGIFFLAVSFLGLSYFSTFFSLIIFLCFLSISISVVSVFIPSLLSSSVHSTKLGVVMGMYEGVGSLGRILGPLFAYVLPISLIQTQYLVYALVLFGLFVFFILNIKRIQYQ